MLRRSVALVFVTLLILTQALGTAASSAPPPDSAALAAAKVDPGLATTLAHGGASQFIVEFRAKASLAAAAKIKDRTARGRAVVAALQNTANTSQKAARALVKATKGAAATSYWMTNEMVVTGDASLASKLAALKDVKSVRAPKVYPLVKPVSTKAAILDASGDPEWGVAKIGAPAAWAEGITGQGIVVSSVDTGVDYTHPALVMHYRGNNGDGTFSHDYNWWDGTGECVDAPCDNVGHGTHTMGTMVGGDGPGPFTPDTGVAPGATWIAAKGCEDMGCSEQALLSAGQWILAPTDRTGANADPSKRPDVVNNSWGSDNPNDTFYQATVAAWRAAGIIPVFASGNPGPSCGAGGSPGDDPQVLSVGATDSKDVIAEFSGRGPSPLGKAWNPDVAAPGVDVVSSIPGGGYESDSGTSMATPHTVGEIALILSARPSLIGDFDGVANAVKSTAIDRIDTSCGAAPGGDPNNVYGDGRIDAAAAVDLVKSGGTLAGTVTAVDGGAPIAGASVVADNGQRQFTTTTAADGKYSLFLAAGSYGVKASAFGFYGATAGSVTITKDQTTTANFALNALPRYHVAGHITAAEDGSPIAGASVAPIGVPVAPVTTAADGSFSLALPIGSYTLRISAGGCTETITADVTSDGPDVTLDRTLFRKLDNFGHGCAPIAYDWTDVSGQTALWGDEIAGRLKLPFAFPFYGASYSQVWLSDNGYLNFLAADQYNGMPSAIPSSLPPNAAIYALWQDLYLDDQSEVDYGVVGDAPNRAFVIAYQGVHAYGASSRLSFEVKLWESGAIDLVYGDNPANPGDGRNALAGIENASGSDALEVTMFEPVLGAKTALRIQSVPSGLVHGTVSDANDGTPIAGATVTASPGGRVATTGADGSYDLRLRPGTYTLAISKKPYTSVSRAATVADGGDLALDAALTGAIATADPMSVSATVEFGKTATASIDLANSGSAPLGWTAKERDLGAVPAPLPAATSVMHLAHRWGPQKTSGVRDVADPGSVPTTPIISDPAGDAKGSVDITDVAAGTDGQSVVSFDLGFTASTPMNQVSGYLFLDTDQNPATGDPAEYWFGLPSQDVGMEYLVDLFGLSSPQPFVDVVDVRTYEIVAEVPATIDGQHAKFNLPLAALGGDDGFINAALVVGDQQAPTDWAPDAGHGTITPYVDVPWLGEVPAAGTVAIGGHQPITLSLGGPTLQPGEYHAQVALLTDAPKQQLITIPVDLTVTLPTAFGALAGTVTDAHTGMPVAGATVGVSATWQGAPLALSSVTGTDGAYRIVGPEGTWTQTITLDGYVPVTRDVTIVRGVTTTADAAIHKVQPHASLTPDALSFVLTPERTGTATITLANTGGHEPLTFTVNEINLSNAASGNAPAAKPTVANASARTAKGIWPKLAWSAPPSVKATGDVLASWPTGLGVAWGVGYTGSVVLSDPLNGLDATFTEAGVQQSSFTTSWAGEWAADMAFDHGRGLIWQVNVGGDNGIYGIDPKDGSVKATITGSAWTKISQRGLAYDEAADEFYIGGWNEGVIYRVAGPSHGNPGDVLGQCTPPDPNISGLAWNGSFNLLWEATNSETDSIYLLDPTTCAVQTVLPHPDGGGNSGAGIETDALGNLWTVGQNSGNAYLIDSGLPAFSDVPWLSENPTSGTVAVDGSQDVTVSVDTTGMAPGVYRAIVVVQTNDPDHRTMQVPVVLVVPAYQQGVNAGGSRYVNANGDVFAADQPYAAGSFGYVGASSARSTKTAIAGTPDQALYNDLRLGMSDYRFSVPDGRYRIDLDFADFLAKKAGSRVFSVTVNGQPTVVNLDVVAEVGKSAADARSIEVDVTGGSLDIGFVSQRGDQPIVNGILVTELPPGSPE